MKRVLMAALAAFVCVAGSAAAAESVQTKSGVVDLAAKKKKKKKKKKAHEDGEGTLDIAQN